jgi:hypothetical protein
MSVEYFGRVREYPAGYTLYAYLVKEEIETELITYLLDCNQLKVLISCISRQDLCMDVVWIRSPAVPRGCRHRHQETK